MTGEPRQAARIRAELPGEEPSVSAVVTAAFGGSVVAELVTSLRRSDWWIDGLSLAAELDGRLVGYLLFTHALVDAARELVEVLVLSPLAVVPDCQGAGIGSALVREGLALVSSRPEPLVFLEGAPRYYPRFGFQRAVPLGLTRPSPRIPEAAFMVVCQASYRPWMRGRLVYPDAFWRHDCVGLRP